MKRRWKSLFLSLNWVFLSVGTSIFIIVTQPNVSSARQPNSIETIVPVSSDTLLEQVILHSKDNKPEESTKPVSNSEESNKKPELKKLEEEEKPTPEELERRQKLMEGDKLYLAGNIAEAEKVYREVKELVTQGNLISNITQYLPLGGTVGQLFGLSYSRDMERQADVLGTRLLVTTGYAADGLRNLMVTLKEQMKNRNAPPTWASSHPGGTERVAYLEDLITHNGYNRYAYEGVAKHQEIRAKVKTILKEVQECREDKKKCSNRNRNETVRIKTTEKVQHPS